MQTQSVCPIFNTIFRKEITSLDVTVQYLQLMFNTIFRQEITTQHSQVKMNALMFNTIFRKEITTGVPLTIQPCNV